jgi:hypothetical protein
MEELYVAYATLYHALLAWLMPFVDADKAGELARRGCGNFVQNAMALIPTDQGPWAMAHTSLLRPLQLERAQHAQVTFDAPAKSISVPSEQLLHEVNRLYTAIYHATIDAHLTIRERALVRALAEQFAPTTPVAVAHSELLAWNRPEAAIIRRMVASAVDQTEHNDLVCLVAETAWRQEDQRSFWWAKSRPWQEEEG